MRANTLLNSGAKVVEPLKFHRSRPKTIGYMWDGKLVLEKDGIKYDFEMWHHGGNEMTESEAMDSISLKALTYQGEYYDVYWNTIMTESEIWLHRQGWFNNSHLESEVNEIIGKHGKGNYNFERDVLNDSQRQELQSFGFIKIAECKSGEGNLWQFKENYPEQYEAIRPERSGVIVTVVDKGDTNWGVGDSIAAEEFDIENTRMVSSGKRPARGEYHY